MSAEAQVTKYIRYAHQGSVSYGVLEGEQVHELDGSPIEGAARTGTTVALSSVELLAPVEPGKVIAIGFNYKSHLDDREPPPHPGVFIKLPSSIVGPGENIVFPQARGTSTTKASSSSSSAKRQLVSLETTRPTTFSASLLGTT